jgi:hypothetical protein
MKWIRFLLEWKPLLEVLVAVVGLLAATLLSIMAIALTRAANQIAAANLRLVERQTAIDEIQLQPRFRLELQHATNEQGTHHILRIFNDGPAFDTLDIEPAVFLAVVLPELGPEDKRMVPVYFFGDRWDTAAGTGLLSTMSSLWTFERLGTPDERNATTEVRSLSESIAQAPNYSQVEIWIFVILDYTDIFGNEQSISYEVNADWYYMGPPSPRPLRGESHAVRIRRQKRVFGHPENLSTVSPSHLRERWEHYPRPEDLWPGATSIHFP